MNYETDFITDKALRDIAGLDNPEEYTACADQLVSRVTAGLHSVSVTWIEIDDDGRKSVMQVRELKTGRGDQPFAYSWIGLTQETCRRMFDGLCPTAPPRTLPPEFRPANQRRLDELERLFREQDAREARDAAAGSSGTAVEGADAAPASQNVAAETSDAAPMETDENVDVTTATPNTAAEAPVAALGATDESAGTPTATLNVAFETTVAAPGAAEVNADAANTALDVAANINS
eukprot:5057472-Pleurochrysis_carterae.AAC.1